MKTKQSTYLRLRLFLIVMMLIASVTVAHAEKYVTEVMVIACENSDQVKNLHSEWERKGYSILNYDLNKSAGGWYIYLAYKTEENADPEKEYITDLAVKDAVDPSSSYYWNGKTYYLCNHNDGFNGNLNRGAGGDDPYLFYTKERINLTNHDFNSKKRAIKDFSIVTGNGNANAKCICWEDSSSPADLNRDAGGEYIYVQMNFVDQKLTFKKEPTFASGLVYNGDTQNLIAKDTWKDNYGTLQYRVNGGSWSSAVPGAISVGDYNVEARLDGGDYANPSDIISKTVTIEPPVVKASSLQGVFNQGEKKVNLTWTVGSIPGNFSLYDWVIYRDGEKIAKLSQGKRSYTDNGFANETSPVYDIYYVPISWDEDTRRDDTKTSTTVSTVRTVPVNDLSVECLDDRIVFAWKSDGYPEGFGNIFKIYVNDEEDPVCTLTPSDMQTEFRWEHRSTDEHTNRQNRIDEETGVPYTEEPLNACQPSNYRIEGIIKDKDGDKVFNEYPISMKAIGNGTLFKEIDASKGAYDGSVKLSWHVNTQGSVVAKTYIVERRRAEQEDEAWETLTRMSSIDDYLFYTDETALPGVYYDYRVTVQDRCDDGAIVNKEITTIGFAKCTGTVAGRVSYGSTGTAVKGVDVVMRMTNTAGDNLEQFHSMYFTDTNGAVTWQYPSPGYADEYFSTDNFSFQMWLFPEVFSNSRIADFGSNNGLCMTADGHLGFTESRDDVTYQATDGSIGFSKIQSYQALVDGKNYKWYSSSSRKTNGVWFCEFTASELVNVTGYTLTTGDDTETYPDRNPMVWKLKAKQNESDSWIVIDQRDVFANADDALPATNSTDVSYDITPERQGTYKYFRFEVSQSGGNDMQLTELKLIGGHSINHLFEGLTLRDNAYNHVTLIRNGSTLTCYLINPESDGSPTILKATATLEGNLDLRGSNQFVLGHFKGAVDEFRLWTKCLDEEKLLENYDHLLVGDEDDLETYWTFDEGLRTQFFDYARDGSNYHKHHGRVGSNAQPSTLTPNALELKAKTDKDGNYIIQGIPFTGEGTSYSIVPMFGIHEFNPNKAILFIGYNSLVHNKTDFEDVSSFTMSGHIYYAGTNVPVEGVQMYVDGTLQNSNGKVVESDANGVYTLSVPIGKHFVEARLGSHKMVAGGRYPTQGVFDFDRAVQYDFADSTLVNFVGRVGGGLSNDTLAVGFGLSRNNIGMATVQLALNNETFSFNCQDDHNSDATTNRSWESDTTSIVSRAWTGTSYDAKYIYIRTDSLTGEFSALVPPLKYKIKSLQIKSNLDIEFGSLPEIDLTNVAQQKFDSIKVISSDSIEVTKTYAYNTKMIKTYFSEPKLELWQMNVNGEGDAPKGVFGRSRFDDFTDSFGTTKIDNLWTIDNGGKISYTYSYPIYDGSDKVKMCVWGYEAYSNSDSGETVADTLALNGQIVTITNEMSDEQMVVARVDNESLGLQPGNIYDVKSNQLILDARGKNEFTFTTGLPNIVAPYTRQLSMSMEHNNRTYTFSGVNAIVLGSLTTGNNFVTLGPDKVAMVLRDPPGANSKTTWSTGTTKTKMKSTAHGFYGDEAITTTGAGGVKFEILSGVGVLASTTELKQTISSTAGVHYSVNRYNQTVETWSVTATKSISTGTGPSYVGASGDVFIGASTNIIVGTCRKLGFFRKGNNYPFELDLKDALSMGDSITTTFMYSAYELENVMIPKWEDTRRSLFTFVKDENEAKNYVNTSDRCVYATWLTKDDPNLGDTTTYRQIAPMNWDDKVFLPDSVLWCTDQITNWRKLMADNEEDKLNAINGADYFRENISFDAGAPNSYSSRCDTTYQKTHNYNHRLGGIVKVGYLSEISAVGGYTKWGWDVNTENGWTMATSESERDENHKEWAQFDYSFSDSNRGTDFSVSTYKSPSGWSDSFFLVGGQSYNPYEGEEKTKYFQPGQHTLSNGTEQMEQPSIRISLDGDADNSAKSITLSDVPAGQTGQLTLHLTNLNNTNQGFEFSYKILVIEPANQQGLQVMMDGYPADQRTITIPAGETIKKVITLRQSDQSVLDYENLMIKFVSVYQPVKIGDFVTFDVHFKPSSSPINLVINEPVMNIENMQNTDGKLEMKVTNFDRQFKNMKKLGVEYLYEGSTSWSQPSELQFVVNKEDTTRLGGQPLPDEGDLRLTYDMKDANLYPQGTYTFRAYTMTMYGTDPIYVYSNEIAVVKDNMAPCQLTTPTPTNGILGYGDDLSVEFNEDIVPGYVSDRNIIITAKLNNQTVKHDVAKRLGDDSQVTINPIFLNGDFTIDLWMMWNEPGSFLMHGRNRFVFAIDEAGHMVVTVGNEKLISSEVLPKNEWTFIAVNFKLSDMAISAIAQVGDQTINLFNKMKVNEDALAAIGYNDDNYLYLGNMQGAMHDLALYSNCRDLNDVAATKYQAKDSYVYGLMNYWPMNEGHGNVAADSRHSHDFQVNRNWLINNTNFAFGLENVKDATGVSVNIGHINTYIDESYAIELWNLSNAASEGEEGIFEAGSKDAYRLNLHYDAEKNIVLDYGTKSLTLATREVAKPGEWHHLALNVVRGQSVGFYVDGKRTAVIAEREMPVFDGHTMTLGRNSKGMFDELRIWKATLSEERLLQNMYNTLDTADVYSRGLVAYYPFEEDGEVYGVRTKVFTLADMAPGSDQSIQYVSMSSQQSDPVASIAPPLKNAVVEQRINAVPVASERKVVINLRNTAGVEARELEGSTLNITVDQIHDMHGNKSAPIRWTAYMQLNTLKWTKDSVTVIKQYGEDTYFNVDIVNKGSKTEYYTLYNIPTWISQVDAIDGSPVETTGELAPQSTKTLRFWVKPLLSVGNYDVTLGLQGNDEILEPLRIVAKVRGKMPNWSVDPDKYESAMSVVGQVYINGILMGNRESCVAAFIDGECRGIANIEPVRGAAYVAMSVYGTPQKSVNGKITYIDQDKPVTFRIWDASTGVAYTSANMALNGAPISISFDPSVNYGNFDVPVIFTKSKLIEQQLELKPNWNWISLGVEPANTLTSDVFGDLTSWNVFIKDRSTGTFYCNGVYWDGVLNHIHANVMYKMALTELDTSSPLPTPLPVTGEPVKLYDTPVTLAHNGWNWIAFLPTSNMTPDQALAGANPQQGDQVKSQKGFAYFGPNGWEGNLHVMESGKGYLYWSNDDVDKEFVYPSGPVARTVRARYEEDEQIEDSLAVFSPVDPSWYPDNMSMVIRLVDGDEEVTTAELGVFIDDECRGAAVAAANSGLYYLLISGQGSGQPMEIRAALDGDIITICDALSFSTDANIGTPWEPFVIDLAELNGISLIDREQADDTEWYTLQGFRLGHKPTSPGIYIHRGKKVILIEESLQ